LSPFFGPANERLFGQRALASGDELMGLVNQHPHSGQFTDQPQLLFAAGNGAPFKDVPSQYVYYQITPAALARVEHAQVHNINRYTIKGFRGTWN
jgi:hypothetical protein